MYGFFSNVGESGDDVGSAKLQVVLVALFRYRITVMPPINRLLLQTNSK